MFAKLSVFVVSTLAVGALAAPFGEGIHKSCNIKNVQCCNSVQDHTDASRLFFTTLLGAQVSDLTGQFATECSPLSVVASAGSSW